MANTTIQSFSPPQGSEHSILISASLFVQVCTTESTVWWVSPGSLQVPVYVCVYFRITWGTFFYIYLLLCLSEFSTQLRTSDAGEILRNQEHERESFKRYLNAEWMGFVIYCKKTGSLDHRLMSVTFWLASVFSCRLCILQGQGLHICSPLCPKLSSMLRCLWTLKQDLTKS